MSRGAKIWIIAAILLILAGCMIFGGVMTVLKWDFKNLSTDKFETNKYEITEKFSSISVNTDTADIVFTLSDTEQVSVVCHEQKNIRHSVGVNDGSLIINVTDTRKWYEHIGINFGKSKITVYLPQGEYSLLSVMTDTGDVEIPKDLKFESINVSGSTGDVTNHASVSETVKIKTSTGKIEIDDISAASLDISASTGKVTLSDVKCEGEIKTKVSTGKVFINDVSCKSVTSNGSTGDISLSNVKIDGRLSIERSTGDVRLEDTTAAEFSIETDTGDVDFIVSDADEIYVETDTGHVKGTLLSEKVFITQSDTGNVSVPESVTGGKCKIITDTGNIEISIVR